MAFHYINNKPYNVGMKKTENYISYQDYLAKNCKTEVSAEEASHALMLQTELLRVLDQIDREQKQARRKKHAALKEKDLKGAANA